MRTIAFIPARCGSKSIPLKNIKDFCGKPLIFWTLKALNAVADIDDIYVASDCNQINEIVEGFKFDKVKIYERDPENAQDHSSTESVILEFLGKKGFDANDLFILVQATSPLIQSNDIIGGLNTYKKEKADSLLSCARVKLFLWDEKASEPINYDYANRPRRQEFKGNLMENGSFYISKVENIFKSKNRISGKIAIYEMPYYTSIDIDEEDEWLIAEGLMRKHILIKEPKVANIKLFITDVDGVLTDAGMYYSENGDELKKFNTKDGKGIELIRDAGIKTALITAENTKIVERRAKKLKFDFVYQGVKEKTKIFYDLIKELAVKPEEIAYIGDDLNDYEIIKLCGLTACPADAVNKIKTTVDYVCEAKGGEGAVREFIEKKILI